MSKGLTKNPVYKAPWSVTPKVRSVIVNFWSHPEKQMPIRQMAGPEWAENVREYKYFRIYGVSVKSRFVVSTTKLLCLLKV